MSEMRDLGPAHSGLGAIRHLDYVVLICRDLAVMRRFYTDVLGFEVHEEVADRWIGLRIGSSLLALRGRARHDGSPTGTGGASVQLAFRVPPGDVEAAAAQLAAHGVQLLEPVRDQPFGHRTLFFADPEHNVIEIYAELDH